MFVIAKMWLNNWPAYGVTHRVTLCVCFTRHVILDIYIFSIYLELDLPGFFLRYRHTYLLFQIHFVGLTRFHRDHTFLHSLMCWIKWVGSQFKFICRVVCWVGCKSRGGNCYSFDDSFTRKGRTVATLQIVVKLMC